MATLMTMESLSRKSFFCFPVKKCSVFMVCSESDEAVVGGGRTILRFYDAIANPMDLIMAFLETESAVDDANIDAM